MPHYIFQYLLPIDHSFGKKILFLKKKEKSVVFVEDVAVIPLKMPTVLSCCGPAIGQCSADVTADCLDFCG